jgi:hypothetical protein
MKRFGKLQMFRFIRYNKKEFNRMEDMLHWGRVNIFYIKKYYL